MLILYVANLAAIWIVEVVGNLQATKQSTIGRIDSCRLLGNFSFFDGNLAVLVYDLLSISRPFSVS
jgi:hypothetical protein